MNRFRGSPPFWEAFAGIMLHAAFARQVQQRIIFITAAVVAAYVAAFYLLMVPNVPAYDSEDQRIFGNCPRFSEPVRVPGPFSIYSGPSSFLNYVFYPFEWIHTEGRSKIRPNQSNQSLQPTAASHSAARAPRSSSVAGIRRLPPPAAVAEFWRWATRKRRYDSGTNPLNRRRMDSI